MLSIKNCVFFNNNFNKEKINELEIEMNALKGKVVDLESELGICRRSFTNRVINKVKYLMEHRRKK